MRRAIPLACCAAALALAAPAFAAPAASPLQIQMAEKMLDFIGFKTQVQLSMENGTLPLSLLDTRPDWTPMFKAAIAEELDHDMPVIDSMIGQTLGKTFTDDELKVGLTIVSDPNLRAIYTAAQNGAPVPDVQIAKTTEAALATPAGQSFASKLQTINDALAPLLVDVTATLVPGTLRRFGDKADAAEIAHRAAAGYAAAK